MIWNSVLPNRAIAETLVISEKTAEVHVRNILGKLGEFGQPVVRKKTEQVLREFTENLGRQLTGDDTTA